ncbi:AbrB/MazE/SpoVT family DNA-binding domain-containing protein [Halorarum halobium]|uniref:AbrB/MazE/SpoVT family DNA-binding domain-containing protein n=1 Tax=Halorarum halobium TaxID=3075121 RepID=UPI0028AC8E12|nr:AbrB/MazE/SpoVT family DNA-binding domain-containing protein [Halobaculum sp. XH14]
MSEATRITEKGQATIPKSLRERYGLEPGDEVLWVETESGILVKKRTKTDARGMLLPDDASESERDAVAAELRDSLRERRERNYDEV